MDVIRSANQILFTLALALETTFGPSGGDHAVVCATGKTLLTNSGSRVLDALDVSHPIARFILGTVKSQSSGATAFVLILAALIREVVEHLSEIRPSDQLRELATLRRAFIIIKHQWLDAILLPELLQAAVCTKVFDCNSDNVAEPFRAAADAIVHTTLAGTFAPATESTLRAVLLDWLFYCIGRLRGAFDAKLKMIADSIPLSIVKVGQTPLSRSHVLKGGFLLRKGLLRRQSTTLVEVKPARFVVLECGMLHSSAKEKGMKVQVSGLQVESV
jgi:hypothetical protein